MTKNIPRIAAPTSVTTSKMASFLEKLDCGSHPSPTSLSVKDMGPSCHIKRVRVHLQEFLHVKNRWLKCCCC